MCGLFGFSKSSELTKLLTPVLAYEMENRGSTSWGVTDGVYTHTSLGGITKSFEEWDMDGPSYHTRAASVGAPTLRNAHPFTVEHEGRRVVGMHNGGIGNWSSLRTKYKRHDLEVDSEHIFRHLAQGLSVDELAGWGAVVWYEMEIGYEAARQRFLSKFGTDNLHMCKYKVRDSPIVYASTREALIRAGHFADVDVDIFYDIKDKVKYSFGRNAQGFDDLFHHGTLPWCESPFSEPVRSVSERTGGVSTAFSRGGWSTDRDACAIPACTNKITPGRQLLCKLHMAELQLEYLPETLNDMLYQ